MKLRDEPFQAIRNKTKTVEMRLNDEKRKRIKAGDTIVFANTATSEEIIASVVGVGAYKDFHELYRHHDKAALGYGDDEAANPADMYKYYPKEKIEEFGALAIRIKV